MIGDSSIVRLKGVLGMHKYSFFFWKEGCSFGRTDVSWTGPVSKDVDYFCSKYLNIRKYFVDSFVELKHFLVH